MSDHFPKDTWAPKSVEETQALYREWAVNYDDDVTASGYVTPERIAAALRDAMPDQSVPILDFGCGTGLSGVALANVGFGLVDGVDISPEMLEKAQGRGIYRNVWQGKPDHYDDVAGGDYAAIVAAGVISAGAAPASTLAPLTRTLTPGGLIAFSYNNVTLERPEYLDAVDALVAGGEAEQIFRESGPHLPGKGMTSDVFILRRLA